jgi:predicted ATP-dependent endonuclease of OLD family
MLRSFEARGINGRISVPKFTFSDDINLLTGANGAGKTTILKLLWYLVSANIERVAQEMTFEFLHLVTSDFEIQMEADKAFTCVNGELTRGNEKTPFSFPTDEFTEEPASLRGINYTTGTLRPSVFFPTFRRIEGGFSLVGRPSGTSRIMRRHAQTYSALERTLAEVAHRLSFVGEHRFVFSISTSDIMDLLTSKYADISQHTNSEQAVLVKAIISEIEQQDQLSHSNSRPNSAKQLANAHIAIENIRKKATEYGDRQAALLQPFATLSSFIETVFADKGITISSGLVLGVGREKISSDLLSAGEKQILSFLVYNAFCDSVPIFIDEPEMSLHVDWQRILFPTLLSQKTNNQFIVATHSPFIYSKYQDKEMPLKRLDWK